jgi:cation:H+ antiporter
MTLLLFVGGLVARVAGAATRGAAEAFGDAMLGFMLPPTIVTLGVTMLRRGGR